MSTQRLLPKMRKGMGRSVVSPLSLLAGVLILWQFVLPSVALASSAASNPTPTPTSNITAPPASTSTAAALPVASPTPLAVARDPAQALAQVSVVRLVATYTSTATPTPGHPSPSISCTGLGTLVGSGLMTPGNPDLTNWVLTDSTAIGSKDCPSTNDTKLASIQVLANDVYTNTPVASTPPTAATLATVTCSTSTIACRLLQIAGATAPVACSLPQCSGSVLFAFTSPPNRPQPFVTLGTTDSTVHIGIQLVNSAGERPSISAKNSPASQYLIPTLFPEADSALSSSTLASSEVGMPLFNQQGQLVDMHLSSGTLDLTTLNTFLTTQGGASRTNTLNTAWTQGINAFYGFNGQSKDANTALVQFQAAQKANTAFQAAIFMSNAAIQAGGKVPGTSSTPTTASSSFLGIPYWVLAIVGIVILLAIFILVSLSFGRKRAQQRRELAHFKADELEAQRRAEIEIQRQTSALGNRGSASNQPPQLVPDLRCPQCNYPVQRNDAYCPNCQTLLSPSASGLHLVPTPLAQPVQPPQQAPDATWIGNYPPPPPQLSPQQVAYAQQPTLVPASSMSEQPTVEMSPEKSKNGQPDPEKTVPYSVQQVRGRNLSLAVGSRSDPGIKRKHKPNEDSLFAVQGARTHNSQPQQFGLFVVADGMGGHANGQDASRLAIQTIIDYVLPKVSASNNMDDADFLKLLADGVQCANEAVHKRNMEERADMGTTMTAAMVVGSTAYISNVGDSRTYLYREPEGLQKITRDHSVVASLVDAGIIQPDDVYTHPKRNQIYRSLGEKPVVEVDSFQVPLQPGDKLLLCSDGLWDMVRDPQIQQLMSNPAPDPNMTGNALIQAALDGGGEDNVSVIVVSITETSNRTGITGIQLLAKPDSVSVPELPST